MQILFLKMYFYILKLEKTTEFIHLLENIYWLWLLGANGEENSGEKNKNKLLK